MFTVQKQIRNEAIKWNWIMQAPTYSYTIERKERQQDPVRDLVLGLN